MYSQRQTSVTTTVSGKLRLIARTALCTGASESYAAEPKRLLSQLDKTDLLVCDELGYLSFSRTGAELLFQVFADRYERGSLLIIRETASICIQSRAFSPRSRR